MHKIMVATPETSSFVCGTRISMLWFCYTKYRKEVRVSLGKKVGGEGGSHVVMCRGKLTTVESRYKYKTMYRPPIGDPKQLETPTAQAAASISVFRDSF